MTGPAHHPDNACRTQANSATTGDPGKSRPVNCRPRRILGRSFSDCTSYAFELQAYDVAGDMAYTAGLEHTSASVDGQPRSYSLRAAQVIAARAAVEGGPSPPRHCQ